MADKEKKENAEDEVDKKGLSNKFIIYGVICFFVISVLSSLSFYLLKPEPKPKKKNIVKMPEVVEIEDPDGVLSGEVYSLKPFIINLRDNTGILQLEVSVEFFDFAVPDDLRTRLPAIRDHIITKASNLSASELRKDGTKKLKSDLMDGINDFTPEHNPIERIYIDSFFIR